MNEPPKQPLEPGYYWIKDHKTMDWEIAHYDGLKWWTVGWDLPTTPDFIGPKIPHFTGEA